MTECVGGHTITRERTMEVAIAFVVVDTGGCRDDSYILALPSIVSSAQVDVSAGLGGIGHRMIIKCILLADLTD